MGTAALGVAALNLNRRFVATSFAPALLNVAFIAAALLLPGWLGARGYDRILAMAAGALLGGALQVVAQWPSLRKIGYVESPLLSFRDPEVREVLRRMAPTLLGIGVYYVDVVVARRLLSELDIGAQSYFGWALRLCDFPQGIFIMALQTAALPSLSLLAARGEHHELERTFAYGMRLTLFVGIAAAFFLVALAEPLVVLLFERGQFDRTASIETARALMAQGIGIWSVAAVRQLVSVYFALGDTRTPVAVAACDFLTFLALALSLRGSLGHVGVSLAVAGASLVQMTLLWLLLRRRLHHLHTTEIAKSAARTILCAALAAGAAFAVSAWTRGALDGTWRTLVPGLAGATAFAVVFLGAARTTKSPELVALVEPVARRLGRRGA
jgi:putative peptidoglycan lipid II flippase